MNFKDKVSLKDFLSYNDNTVDLDESKLKEWHSRTFFAQMMDVWGEVDKTVRAWKLWNENRTDERYDNLTKQLLLVHRLCLIVYSDPKISDNAKIEIKTAEWELYDFYLWDNIFQNTIDTVSRWFNQWCYDINYDLL